MISSALLALSLAVCSFGASVSVASERRNSVYVPNYQVGEYYPDYVTFIADYRLIQGNTVVTTTSDYVIVDRDSFDTYDFELDREYILLKAGVQYDDSGYLSWTQLVFVPYFAQSYTTYGETALPYGAPFSFSFWHQQTSYYVTMVGYDVSFTFAKGTIGSPVYAPSNIYMADREKVRYPLTTSTSGPYYVRLSDADFFDTLCAFYAAYEHSLSNMNGYYQDGYNAGKSDGERIGHDAGYQEAVDDIGHGGVFQGLFGALVNVPISIFNGLSPMVVWDIPVITIILTFFVIGVIVFIVKKVVL